MYSPLPREAQILKRRREELHITQAELSLEVGIQLRQYQRFEYGSRSFSNCNLRTALKICAALQLDPFEVVFEDDQDLANSK
ncbi:MAG: helix-turn-helix transcriptional regulator [Oscillospiraceae bacterium]|nr:helix-turn-helix transcriptional regulator [Oscillospiraceae bacterium]